jgi:hypothetical protein
MNFPHPSEVGFNIPKTRWEGNSISTLEVILEDFSVGGGDLVGRVCFVKYSFSGSLKGDIFPL